ncbi:MAG TPA: hypothetical protein VMV36_06770 [Ignavibacteriaceae bacterium]|nr:hypothetical protein [Ignavibacteriaceae bacterium]
MKKLFTNYNFEFNKNEKKILKTFCNQNLKQIQGDNKYFAEIKVFNSLLEKLASDSEIIKLTKDERTRLKFSIEKNVEFLEKEMKKSWFLKRWLYRSMYTQYENILDNHFKD